MGQAEILQRIKDTDNADIDPDAVAEIYAYVLSQLSRQINESDLQRLILLGAGMYKNGIASRAQLQMPHPRIDTQKPDDYLQ